MTNHTIERLYELSGIKSFRSPEQLFVELYAHSELYGSECSIPAQAVVEEIDYIADENEVYKAVRRLRENQYLIASGWRGFYIPNEWTEIRAFLHSLRQTAIGWGKLYQLCMVNTKTHFRRLRGEKAAYRQASLSEF